jgi:hypothetical protein
MAPQKLMAPKVKRNFVMKMWDMPVRAAFSEKCQKTGKD